MGGKQRDLRDPDIESRGRAIRDLESGFEGIHDGLDHDLNGTSIVLSGVFFDLLPLFERTRIVTIAVCAASFSRLSA